MEKNGKIEKEKNFLLFFFNEKKYSIYEKETMRNTISDCHIFTCDFIIQYHIIYFHFNQK